MFSASATRYKTDCQFHRILIFWTLPSYCFYAESANKRGFATPPYIFSAKGLRMIVLVSLIVLLRKFLFPLFFAWCIPALPFIQLNGFYTCIQSKDAISYHTLRMILLVSLIVLLRELLVSTIFRMVHPYIAIHSVEWFLQLFHTYLWKFIARLKNAVTRMHTLAPRLAC